MRIRTAAGRMIKIIFWIALGLAGLVEILVGVYYLEIHQTNGQITTNGQMREYLLYVPSSYQPSLPTALVISIHGFAEWPAHQAEISRWNDLADQNGFIVVYPAGTGFPPRWSASGPGWQTDVKFISDLIDHLAGQYAIDPARIYANGLSNGGGMSFLLSCKLADRIAAAGGVSGAYLLSWKECDPAYPVPFIAFHGTGDPIVPYEGGSSSSFRQPFPSIQDWVRTLASHNGCAGTPAVKTVSAEVSGLSYTLCQRGADVTFYTIRGGGHAWPGGPAMPPPIVGYTSQEIDATRVIWEFFQQHPLQK